VAEEQRPVAELLAEAIEHLEPADRQRVTAWCLSRLGTSGRSPLGWGAGPTEFAELVRTLARHEPDLPALYPRHTLGSGEHQMVPVRLPTELHARLRAWSNEHGFSMATIVRGLVARFLDEQTPAPQDS
jgi:hypothetical protein